MVAVGMVEVWMDTNKNKNSMLGLRDRKSGMVVCFSVLLVVEKMLTTDINCLGYQNTFFSESVQRNLFTIEVLGMTVCFASTKN